MDDSYDYVCKVIIVGDSAVGKTSLLTRYVDNEFSDSHLVTIGVDTKIKTVWLPDYGKTVKLQFWDTAGQERYQSVTSMYYKGARAALVVYAVDDKTSFDHVKDWIEQVVRTAPTCKTFLVVGNKCDVPDNKRQVMHKAGHDLADEYQTTFVETSAKSSDGVEEAFFTLAKTLVSKYERDGTGALIRAGETGKKLFEFPRPAGEEETEQPVKKGCC